MIRIAICDDDIQELARISGLLNRYQSDKAEAFQYDIFHSAMDLLEAMRRMAYQILFLDILMPGINGIEVAREIREFNDETNIIFLTSSPEYAIESYAVNAHYYLLKPGTEKKLYPILDKLLLKMRRAEDSLVLVLPSGIVHLPFSHIEYLEVINKKLLFHLTDGNVRQTSGSLSDFEGVLLARREFIKVHRSFIVNMEHIESLNGKMLTTYRKQSVPISRLIYPEVREQYMKYLFIEKGVE